MENKLGGSGLKKPDDLDVRLDDDNEIPSIFSCRQSTEAIPAYSGGSSSSAHTPEKKRKLCFELHKTKHKIFLSHSGAEKSFVEQLCVDLERRGYFFPFFDQRNHSLPKGKKFAPLILEAAKQCHVAVIVLSETFLASKWPMIELVEFYKAKRDGSNSHIRLLPLFFKLSIEDLDEKLWRPKWEQFADGRNDLNLWSEAVKELVKMNGFIFEQARKPSKNPPTGILYRSEVTYREAIADEIFQLSPPDVLYGSQKTMIGYDRLCEMLSSQFVENTKTGVLQLGLYGVPGLGKTTVSKALCDYFHSKLMGRVCYVDVDDASTNPLSRQKEVLKKLWGYQDGVLNSISNVDQARTLMRDHLERERGMKQQPSASVLLVIDNVSVAQDSVDEARAFVEAGFNSQSRIMVTSRGRSIVELVLPDAAQCCKPVPSLTDEEARAFYLDILGHEVSSTISTDSIQHILGLCRFLVEEVDSQGDVQYHPMALRALANFCRSQVCRNSLSLVEERLNDMNRCYRLTLFEIFELQFKSLDSNQQRFFLDIALYGKEWHLADGSDWCTWLGGLHRDMSPSCVEMVMEQLEMYGIINGYGATMMHQLYVEFAIWHVTEKGTLSESQLCVKDHDNGPWTRIRMVSLRRIPRERLQEEWKNVLLLQLHSCEYITELPLEGFYYLRHLELIDLRNLKVLTLLPENNDLRFLWLSGLTSLQHLPDFRSCCMGLQVILITKCFNLREPLRLGGLKSLHVEPLRLGELDFNGSVFRGMGIDIASLSSKMKLDIVQKGEWGKNDKLNLLNVRACERLEWPTLEDFSVQAISGLPRVPSLGRFGGKLIVYTSENVEDAPDGGSEIFTVCRITDAVYLFVSRRWRNMIKRRTVTSHWAQRWGEWGEVDNEIYRHSIPKRNIPLLS